jgi:hypothetical protein
VTIGEEADHIVEVLSGSSDPLELANALIDFAHAILAEASHATDTKLVGVVFE